MNEYDVVLAYAAFAFVIFTVAMLWRRYRDAVQKRFNLLNYSPKDEGGPATHSA